jgi:SNF2 family DNA or RNA helicase
VFYGRLGQANLSGRRTKDIIKDQIPKKYDEVVFCPLTEIQLKVYKRILGMEAVQNMIRKDERCDCGSGKKYGNRWSISLYSLNVGVLDGRSAVTHSPPAIFSSICLR